MNEYKLNGDYWRSTWRQNRPRNTSLNGVGNVLIITPGQPGDVHLSRSVNILTSKSLMRVNVTLAHARRYKRIAVHTCRVQ